MPAHTLAWIRSSPIGHHIARLYHPRRSRRLVVTVERRIHDRGETVSAIAVKAARRCDDRDAYPLGDHRVQPGLNGSSDILHFAPTQTRVRHFHEHERRCVGIYQTKPRVAHDPRVAVVRAFAREGLMRVDIPPSRDGPHEELIRTGRTGLAEEKCVALGSNTPHGQNSTKETDFVSEGNRWGTKQSGAQIKKMGKPCASPFVPFGALSGAACTGASLASAAQCEVACYAGFVSGGGKATCTDGTLAFSGCTPGPSHRTIVLKGTPDSERGLNGTFEAETPYTTPLKWKSTSTTGAVIEAPRAEPDRLDIYMGGDFKGAIEITHAGGNTTMRVLSPDGGVYPGASASFGKDATATATEQPVAAECADLRACLAQTPLDLAACAGAAQAAQAAGSASCAAAAPKSLVASGSRLDHEGTKVELYTLERALVGSDARGAFVVLPGASTTTAKTQSGKMLFVAAGATKGALFDVLLDQTTKVWRAKKPDWVLIVGLIGGGVVLLLLVVISLVYAFGKPPPYAQMM